MTTAPGPLEKAIGKRRELLAKNSDLRTEIERNAEEIARIDAALAVMRDFAPLRQLPGLDEDARSVYGALASMTVPDGLATILRKRGEPLTSRELCTILEQTGKLVPDNKNNLIGVIGALKRNPGRFKKVRDTWTLVQSNGHLPGLEVDDTVPARG
jgi:hypothetical protein